MFHTLMTLIIGITLCLIAREITARKCPENEVLKFSAPRNPLTCGNKGISRKWKFGNHCVCAHQWLVRDEAGDCIPVWMCPEACPSNQEFKRCANKDEQFLTSGHFTAKEILKLCKPVCSCQEGYTWRAIQRECVWSLFKDRFIGNRG